MSDIEHTTSIGEDFLSHYGKKGMRWGHRRGSKTKPTVKMPGSRRYNPGKLSNEDLRKINARLKLEQEYISLNKRNEPEKAKRWYNGKIAQAGDIAFKLAIGYAVKQKLSGEPIFPSRVKKGTLKTGKDAVDEALKTAGKIKYNGPLNPAFKLPTFPPGVSPKSVIPPFPGVPKAPGPVSIPKFKIPKSSLPAGPSSPFPRR